MTAKERGDSATDASTQYGDLEIAAASGVPLPSLRVLQAAGAIRSQKVPKPHGGFRRTWPEDEALKASIAAAMSEHFAWNIRIVSEAMAKANKYTWSRLLAFAIAKPEASEAEVKTLVKATDQDWYLELVDRKFLFLKSTEIEYQALPDTAFGNTNLLLGMVKKDGFILIPWAFGSPLGRERMKTVFEPEDYQLMKRHYQLAMAAHGNFLSKATINASMQVRMASHRLQGRKAHFVQEMIKPGRGKADP
jgi:hypothetical protein